MLVLDSAAVRKLISMPRLIEGLRKGFRNGCIVPLRQVLKMPGGGDDRYFVSMPAFDLQGGAAVKLATVFPDNPGQGLPSIHATIIVFSKAGVPIAVLDGTTITYLRTGAASALASTYLSRSDSSHLVIIGTGALAPTMAAAHCAVRPITQISVWGRRHERAVETKASIRALVDDGIDIVISDSLEHAVTTADIISCATSSPDPLLFGAWLKPGVFVDLVGSFSPSKREADDDVVRRSRIFVDVLEGALAEAGDIIDPLARGIITREQIEGELADLVCGRVSGRVADDETITFKSVGTAIEDLAASLLLVETAMAEQQ